MYRFNNADYFNSILKKFLYVDKNKFLYDKYNKYRDEKVKKLLEVEFHKFYSKIVFVSYFSKVLYFTAQKYDQKIRKYRSLNEEFKEETVTYNYNEEHVILNDYYDIGDYFENKDIFKSICELTERQKQILYLLFVKEMTELEIANVLKISQQAVNKIKNKVLKDIKNNLNFVNKRCF